MMTGRMFVCLAAVLAAVTMVAACSGDDARGRGGEDDRDVADVGADGTSGADAADDDTGGDGPGPGVRPTGGPAEVLDLDEALDTSRIALQIKGTESGRIPLAGVGAEVYRVEFSFRSLQFFGTDWRHDATMFVPTELNPAMEPGAFILVQFGTENPVERVSDPANFRNNYAAHLTAQFGIPSVVVPNLPGQVDMTRLPEAWRALSGADVPASCFSQNLAPRRYVPCMLEILRHTDDPLADPFRYIGFAWMRAATAAIEVARRADTVNFGDDGPIALELSRALILADGERAVGARMAAAADPRLDGVFGGSADFGGLDAALPAMRDAWHQNHGWFDDLEGFEAWIGTEAGARWLRTVDPTRWAAMLQGKSFVNAAGTADPFFPLGSYRHMAAAFPADTNRLVVSDHTQGIGTAAHLGAWTAFVTHVYFARPWLTVSATATEDRGNIVLEASTAGQASAVGAMAWFSQQHRAGDDRDFRDTVWTSEPMAPEGNASWRGQVAPVARNRAIYIEVYDEAAVPTILAHPAQLTVPGAWSSEVFLFD